MRKVCGFTLIELLVVISIISLLSSVVLASLNSARDKGKTAAGQRFSSSLYNSLGSEAMAVWLFEEGSGSVSVADFSGNGNTGSVVGATWVTDTYHPSQKSSLNFNGTSQYVSVPGSPSLNIRTAGTISLWVKPTITDGALRNVIIKGGGAWATNDYSIFFYGNRFYGNVANGTSGTNYSGPRTEVVDSGRWYHVAFSWDTTRSKAEIYLNGSLADSKALSITPTDRIYDLRIAASNAGYYFGAVIDDVRIYATSLSLTQIENLYADGASRYLSRERVI